MGWSSKLRKIGLLIMLFLNCILINACEEEALILENATVYNLQTEMKLTRELMLQNNRTETAVLTYYPGLKLKIGEEEQVISEDLFEREAWNQPPNLEVHVIDQGERSNKIILVTLEKPDPDLGSTLRLWAFEFYDNGYFKQIWELDHEAIDMPYAVTEAGGYEIHLHNRNYTEALSIDAARYQQLEESGKRLGELQLSAPIDFLLEDVIWEEQKDIIVRRKVIGDKPECNNG